ncbi:Synaptobrevin-like protein YKT6 [Hibiscus syriacus]|uniref:Synaptobrevin-like protein YKT6 n=1 Tax=Hibiscus syriacus TaxID=106335 RepID=A0A6A2Z3I5_HIBSY|nr:Synaptobrevin-like protein YKT6 [Hibiscus syriacus]
MKIIALLVLKCQPEGSDPIILANASDSTWYILTKEMDFVQLDLWIVTILFEVFFASQPAIAKSHFPAQSLSLHLIAITRLLGRWVEVDVSMSVLNVLLWDLWKISNGNVWQVVDEYQRNFGESWRTAKADNTQIWPYLDEVLTKFQDPADADKLLKIQRELDETKIIFHKTIDSMLARGEKLDSLVEKSSDHSATSQKLTRGLHNFSNGNPQVRGANGPIFEDGPNFDMTFRLFHGRDGVVPLSEQSSLYAKKAEPETAPPKFNPLAAKAATISLSSFGPGGPFSFDANHIRTEY